MVSDLPFAPGCPSLKFLLDKSVHELDISNFNLIVSSKI